MSRLTASIALALLASLAGGCGGGEDRERDGEPPPTGPASAGLVNSLETIRPSFSGTGASRIRLVAAGNGFAAFQVALQGGEDGAQGVTLELAPFRGPGGAIGREEVSVYEERLIELDEASDVEGDAGPWPDPLVPAVDSLYGQRRNAFPLDVPSGEARGAWVDVHIPPELEPGVYEGELTVSGEGLEEGLAVEIEIIDVELPSGVLLDSAFGLRPTECAAHGIDCVVDPARGWRLRSLYVRSALENRIGVSDPALAVGTERDSELFHRHVLPLLRGERLPGEGGELLPPRFAGARPTRIRVDDAIEWWRAEARAGGFERLAFSYPCDEPDTDREEWDRCIDGAESARTVWPGLRTLVTASIEATSEVGALPFFDVIATIVNDLEDRPGSAFEANSRPLANGFIENGGSLWAYNSCLSHGCEGTGDEYFVGWPSYAIDQPGTEQRAMGPLAFRYDLSGELYYALNRDLGAAWSPEQEFGGSGDGTLFYPGRPDLIGGEDEIPIESIRIKRIRDGREDYALLRALEDRGQATLARRLAKRLVPVTYGTDVETGTYDRFRERIAAALSR